MAIFPAFSTYWLPRRSSQWPWGYLFLPTFAIGALLLANEIARRPIACPFKAALGLPCPSCGSTRMGFLLLKGDIFGAFLMNPGVFLGLVGFVLFCVWDIWAFHRSLILDWEQLFRWSGFGRRLCILALLLNWTYLLLLDR